MNLMRARKDLMGFFRFFYGGAWWGEESLSSTSLLTPGDGSELPGGRSSLTGYLCDLHACRFRLFYARRKQCLMQSDRGKSHLAGTVLAVTVIAIVTADSVGAQKRPAPPAPAFRADSTLVLVPVAVIDRRGAIVNGLASGAFTLTEDGVRQQIRSFSEEDAPVSMGIVLDLSGSMRGVLGAAKESLRAVMKDANPTDEAFLNTVSTRPRAYSGFTRYFDEILSRLAFESAGGDTALIDTIFESLHELRSGIHARKVLLIISDGMDNHSRYSRGEVLELAVESDAQIYTD